MATTNKALLIKHINETFAGKWTQVAWGEPLGKLLTEIVQALPDLPETSLLIQAKDNATVEGFSVPKLTADQVTQAYNATVNGRLCVIISKDEKSHFVVNQADILNSDPAISILFYSSLLLTYLVDGTSVDIEAYKLTQPKKTLVLGELPTGSAITPAQMSAIGWTSQVEDDVNSDKYGWIQITNEGATYIMAINLIAPDGDGNFALLGFGGETDTIGARGSITKSVVDEDITYKVEFEVL